MQEEKENQLKYLIFKTDYFESIASLRLGKEKCVFYVLKASLHTSKLKTG